MALAKWYGWSYAGIMAMPWPAFCAALDYRADELTAEAKAQKDALARIRAR